MTQTINSSDVFLFLPVMGGGIKMEQDIKAEYDIRHLLPIAMIFVVLGIAVTYGLDVMADVQADMTSGTLAYNATGDAMTGVAEIPSKMPTLATIVIAAVIIGVLVVYLARKFA